MTRAIITLIEGPDGAGKTFAADARARKEELATSRPPFRVHNVPPQKGTTSRQLYKLYMGQLHDAVQARILGVSTIIDRSWPSEVVYGGVYRQGSLLTERQVRRLENYAAHHDIVMVGLEEATPIRRDRIEARGEKWDDQQYDIEVAYHHYFRSHEGWITVSSSLASH